ncbi:hypothetical protein CEXT_582361 [Caerostris extrusa]|uniref:Uncharacterized protein n=1 Tax=Caerostris extrusa TaxID=172846 RepID=A0AAV4UAY5_CAEEX|nr:hypothetical protein CEXT_582361 [Caerostris extrusa]
MIVERCGGKLRDRKPRKSQGKKSKKRKIEGDSSSEEKTKDWMPSTDNDEDVDESCMHELISDMLVTDGCSFCTICKDYAHDA